MKPRPHVPAAAPRRVLAIEKLHQAAALRLDQRGVDPIESRPGFAALLDRVEDNGVRVVLVEDASRFTRDLVAQELSVLMLIKRGMRVVTASGDDLELAAA